MGEKAWNLAQLCEAVDLYDVCTCDGADEPHECVACVVGKAWRSAYVGILQEYEE